MAPTIVIIPGCWHQASTFTALRANLETTNPTVSRSLPSCYNGPNAPSPPVTQATDVAFVRNELIMPLLDEGKDVIVFMHSYGGSPGSGAVKGLGPDTRAAQGKRGAVVGMVYLATLLVPEGESSGSYWPQIAAPGFSDEYSGISEDMTHTYARPEKAQEHFYHDLPSPEAERHISEMCKHAIGASMGPIVYAAWAHPEFAGRCRYIETTNDKIVLPEMQKRMVANTGMKVGSTLDAGHSPFLSGVAATADAVRKCVAEIAKNHG